MLGTSSLSWGFFLDETNSNNETVIATNVGGNADIVNDETNCGFLVEFDDRKAMAEAIKTMIEDKEKYKEFSENALKAAHNRFNLDELLKETYNYYF